MRCVLVNEPSYSATCADGKKNTSVLMSAGWTRPPFTSGAVFQNVADSVTQLSFTTSHSSVATQRHDAGAGPADVAEQQLQQRRAADDLGPVRVLGPGDRVGERRRAVG